MPAPSRGAASGFGTEADFSDVGRGKAAGCDNSCRLRFETENAAELPVVQPTKFELVITCRPETVPARLLTRDDEVVE